MPLVCSEMNTVTLFVGLFSFHCKPRASGVSLDSSGMENIAQVRGNRAEFCQNYAVRKAVSAIFRGYISAEKLESES